VAYDEKLAARVRALLADRTDVSERTMFGATGPMGAGSRGSSRVAASQVTRPVNLAQARS
jgi:hypothetical protein